VKVESPPLRLILGSGRSGTTWVLDCLAEANGLRPLFEPMHPSETALAAQYAYQVLAAGDNNEELRRYFLELAGGGVRSGWIDYRGPKGLLFPHPKRFMTRGFPKRWLLGWKYYLRNRRKFADAAMRDAVLIKCIRANLFAGWLSRDVGFRTVLVVRHPCAAVESQCRLGKPWDPTQVLERYRTNQRLHDVTEGRYLKFLNSELTKVQALTLNWIIENQWPVERAKEDGYSVVFYEDLLLNPESVWPYLCDSLGLANVPDTGLLRKPSQQAADKSADHRQLLRGARWRTELTPEQLDSIQNLLDATDCTIYTTDAVEPTMRWNNTG